MKISISNYGLCLFSYDVLEKFLPEKQKDFKDLLRFFEKNHDIYIESLKLGIWLPIVQIDSIDYSITYNKELSSNILFEHSGFNIKIGSDGLWLADIGLLNPKRKKEFEFQNEILNTLADGQVELIAKKIPIESGMYKLKIVGGTNYDDEPIFQFTFNKCEEFLECKDPRNISFDFS